MTLQTATAHATSAASAVTNSSGATCTLSCPAGQTLYLSQITLINGPALALASGDITITGLAIGSLSLPLVQVLQDVRVYQLTFVIDSISNGLAGSGQNTNIVVTIPVLLGGAETTVILVGESS